MKIATASNINQISKESNSNTEIVNLFIDPDIQLISDIQIHESIRVRQRIIQKTEFDYRLPLSGLSLENELAKNLYLVSVQFNPATHYSKFNSIQQMAQANALASLYKDLAHGFIDHAFSRNSHLLPLLQLFLDAEGTRYAGHIEEIRIPHYHGFLLLQPKTVERFDDWLLINGKETVPGQTTFTLDARHHAPIETITFSKFDPSRGPLESMISYVTKFARYESFWNSNADLERSIFHPQVPKRSYPFYGKIDAPLFTNDEFISFEKSN